MLSGWRKGVSVSRASQEPRRSGEKGNGHNGHSDYGKFANGGGNACKRKIPSGVGDGDGAVLFLGIRDGIE